MAPDWRIACNFVGKGYRRQAVATAALNGALELIAALGGGRVEGYPEGADSVPAGFLFNGPLSSGARHSRSLSGYSERIIADPRRFRPEGSIKGSIPGG